MSGLWVFVIVMHCHWLGPSGSLTVGVLHVDFKKCRMSHIKLGSRKMGKVQALRNPVVEDTPIFLAKVVRYCHLKVAYLRSGWLVIPIGVTTCTVQ